MNKKTKLIILIILSLSVYFIYKNTNNKSIKILNIGDGLSIGINSYGITEYSHINYYKDYLTNDNKKVKLINDYSEKDLSIKRLLEEIKTNSKLKRDLIEAHQLFLTLGYNDLLYQINLEENLTINSLNKIINEIEKDYNETIKEIRKYYKNKIIIIGYYKSNKDDYYINIGIRKLNNILKNTDNIYYIDTYNLLNNKNKYFSNPNSYYPNRLGYLMISDKLIRKTLEK